MGVHEFILKHGAYPSPLLYKGFPKSCCTSVNNILVHGIPDELSPPLLCPCSRKLNWCLLSLAHIADRCRTATW